MTFPTFTLMILKVIIAAGLINVWIVRFNQPTSYRGGTAQTLPQEFAAYGLPSWFVYVIGFLKISIAFLLIATVLVPSLLPMVDMYALMLLAVLMMGAITMHLKVRDPIMKFLPALGMLGMAVVSILLSFF